MENGTTTATYSAWTEWFPSPQQQLPDFAIHAGDTINIQIVADSKISGYTLLHNRRTGQKTHTPYTNQTTPLCLDNAEWVIESHLIFAKFGLDGQRTAGYSPFKFEHASWTTKGRLFFCLMLGSVLVSSPLTFVTLKVARSILRKRLIFSTWSRTVPRLQKPPTERQGRSWSMMSPQQTLPRPIIDVVPGRACTGEGSGYDFRFEAVGKRQLNF